MKGFGTVTARALSGDKDQRFIYLRRPSATHPGANRKTLTEIRKAPQHVASIGTCFWDCMSSSPTPRATSGYRDTATPRWFNFAGLGHRPLLACALSALA
jgi:hypothetical protein